MIDPKTYCKDCKRSIYSEYKDCDINIENDGLYARGDSECGWHLGKKGDVKFCADCGRRIKWD